MQKANDLPATVDEYLATVPKEFRPVLEQLRTTIKAAAPDAEETISYRMPSYKLNGPLIFFAAQRNFCSLYAVNKSIQETFAKELKVFEISGTTIHFTPQKPIPAALVKRIVKERMKQNLEKRKSKTA